MIIKDNSIICGDVVEVLKNIQDNYVDLVITDPPYDYEFIGKDWDSAEIKRRLENAKTNKSTLVKNIPYGSGRAGGVRNSRWYKKHYNEILSYTDWCKTWGSELFRVTKAGSYVLVFSSVRSLAHIQVALESCGFYSRDVMVYRRNSGIPKGLNAHMKLEKLNYEHAKNYEGWYSCLRGEWEAIVVTQKPLVNNYINTVLLTGNGLIDCKIGEGFQSNILEGFRKTAGETKLHINTKPISLLSHLIKMFLNGKEKVVLDCFCGSGTTLLAAKNLHHKYFGIDVDPKCVELTINRVENKNGCIY